MHVVPTLEPLVFLADEVERDILESGAHNLYLVVFLFGQSFAGEFLLAHVQEELSLLMKPLGGCSCFFGHQVELLQHVVGGIEQSDGLLPEPHVGFHIAFDRWFGRTVVAAFGTCRLLGVEDGVVFQFSPRGQRGVQVLLLPLLGLHEVGIVGVGVVHVGQRVDPSFGNRLVPTDLLHAHLHLLERGLEFLPASVFVLLVDEDSFGGGATERGEDVESAGHVALGGSILRINHFVQHLGVGLVTLRHQIDFVGAGILELGTYARLLLGYLLNGLPHLVVVFLARDDAFCVFPRLLHLVVDLQDGDIVGLAHQEGDGFEEGVIQLLDARVAANGFGHKECRLELRLDIGAEVHVLKPHHRAEVALDSLGTGVVAAWAEERIAVHHILIAQEVGISVLGTHDAVDFVLHHTAVFIGNGGRAFTRDECLGDGEIGLIVASGGLQLLAHGC